MVFFHADPHPGNLLLQLMSEEENRKDQQLKTKERQGKIGNIPYEITISRNEQLRPFRLNVIDFGMVRVPIDHVLQAKTRVIRSLPFIVKTINELRMLFTLFANKSAALMRRNLLMS